MPAALIQGDVFVAGMSRGDKRKENRKTENALHGGAPVTGFARINRNAATAYRVSRLFYSRPRDFLGLGERKSEPSDNLEIIRNWSSIRISNVLPLA